MNFSYRKLNWAVTVLSLVIAAASANCQNFTCEGYLEVKKIDEKNPSRVPVVERHVDFLAEIDLARGLFSYFDLSMPPRSASTMGDFLLNRLDRSLFQASLSVEGYPIDWDWDQRLVWFIYAGRDFLRPRDGAQVILPRGDPRREAHVVACRATMQWGSSNDVSPATVEFEHDVGLMAQAHNFFELQSPGSGLDQKERATQSLQRVLHQGQLIARFRVEAFTNVARARIPQLSLMQTFNSYGGLIRIYECEISKVAPLERPVRLISTPPGARLIDRRVRDVRKGINYVSYTLSNGVIPSLTNPSLIDLANKESSTNMHLRPPPLK